MTAKESVVCIFCSQTGKISLEHLLPNSWQKEFPDSKGMSLKSLNWQTGDRQQYRRPGTRYGWSKKGPCEPCNNGWMNQIDLEVRDLVFQLAKGDSRLISATDALLFSAWATKHALLRSLIDIATGGAATVQRFHEFYNDRAPFTDDSVQVATITGEYQDSANCAAQIRLNSDEVELVNVVTLTIGRLWTQTAIMNPKSFEARAGATMLLSGSRGASSSMIRLVSNRNDVEVGPEMPLRTQDLVREPAAILRRAPYLGD